MLKYIETDLFKKEINHKRVCSQNFIETSFLQNKLLVSGY